MEYISAEEFLKQPEDVQKVFIDWWQPEIGDIIHPCYEFKKSKIFSCIVEIDKELIREINQKHLWLDKDEIAPLFTEGQLRKFIEDKTGGKIHCSTRICSYGVKYDIGLWEGNECLKFIKTNTDNLLQAYWEVACKIESEEVSNE